ncbi:MAG TPA: stage II sporulation protein M [Anaerolineae bacterium]|nr:stage II sporulation protein M [Anaerolineae bacterium]HQH38716.1 stage II sporulation protein M [Anaerolineae bacterium]
MIQTWEKSGSAGLWSHLEETVGPILVITRREIKDTLRDWRIVLPIVILVTAFPFLANLAASRGMNFVNQYGANLIIERLLPFLMLVVGFFPSSFSLVIALETFSGEKERHSLESLLATPLTDLQLYIGKLLAATIPPILASYLGMAVYLLLLTYSMNWRPTSSLLLISMGLSTTEALVMVAGAVIVSSQSTSVRAANLLASFIIIPMAFLLQAEASLLLFANYTTLWFIVAFLLVLDILLIRLGIRVFNREQLLGHDIDQLNLRYAAHTFWEAAWPHHGLKALYTKEIPILIRRLWPELLLTTVVIFGGGMIVGQWGIAHFPLPTEAFNVTAIHDLESIKSLASQSGLVASFSPWAVFLNNVRSLLVGALLGLFSLGILALLLLLAPVAIIVYIIAQIGNVGFNPWLFLGATVVPHGIVELPTAILATAQAMRMGDIILTPADEGGGVPGMIRELGHLLKLMVSVVCPLLLLAAWIETHITPQLLLAFLSRG